MIIADDSAFMRKVLSDLFTKHKDFQVAGTARNGQEAVDLVAKLKPDLLTLDVHMPVLDGLSALKIIMKENPVPVMMFSSLTKEGAEETIKALELGAVDFLCKTGGSISRIDAIEDDIIEKCRSVAQARISTFNFNRNIFTKKQEAPNLKRINIFERKGYNVPSASSTNNGAAENSRGVASSAGTSGRVQSMLHRGSYVEAAQASHQSRASMIAKRENPLLKQRSAAITARGGASGHKIVALGTSTGGPKALQYVIPKLPGSMPCGMVVVQHMPAGFTKSLADRLNSLSQVTVSEAVDNEEILPGHVYIAPGNYHLTVKGETGRKVISLNQDPPLASHRPAVDVMFDSVVKYGSDVVSVILTGMGCDGAAGMKKIKAAGGRVIAESEETTVVYGMPKAVVEAGIADEVLPVEQIAEAIMEMVRK